TRCPDRASLAPPSRTAPAPAPPQTSVASQAFDVNLKLFISLEDQYRIGTSQPRGADALVRPRSKAAQFRRMKPQRLKIFALLFLTAMFAIHVTMAWNSRDLIRKGYPDFTIFYSAGKI